MDCIKHVPKTRTMRKYNVEGKRRGHFRVGRVTFPSPETLECCYQRPSIAPLCGHIAAQNYSFLSASSLRPLLFTSLPIHALHWPYKPLRRLSQPTRVSPVLHILSSTPQHSSDVLHLAGVVTVRFVFQCICFMSMSFRLTSGSPGVNKTWADQGQELYLNDRDE